ncbi:hypothetical protein [Aeromicrobium sp.]|uniref:LysM peptidoglycan-binding domain-containing protein n=1 Tax=Aeromicrobium sp. TaxID=1871063 RepID=UPI0019A3AE05|nr:hypothetical protein [Aeromicrobium sp.]MBC7630620.1 hypothetical protein [Aeromicrobium sp.]
MKLSFLGWAMAILAASSLWLLAPHTGSSVAALSGTDFPAGLLAAGSLLQLTLSAWVTAVLTISTLTGPSTLFRALTPQLLRRAMFAGTVGALALVPAHADQASPPLGQTSWHSLTGLRLPDRPSTVALVTTDPGPSVVARPGDSLWAIAARSLPTAASDIEIARECRRWWTANRDVIGDNPHLIFPAQRLVPPSGKDPA